MTQIVKQQSQVTFSGNPFVAALTAKPVKDSSDFEIAEAISSGIEKAVFDLGLRQISDDDLNLLKFGILHEVKTSFTTLTIDEIKNAFHYGVRGKYGEVFGLNVAQAAKWMSSYMTDHTRVEARKELAKAADQSNEPSPDEKFSTAKGLSLDAYILVKANHPVGITGVAVYTFLNALGLIHADYKKGIMKEALNVLVVEKERDIANSTELVRRRQMNADLVILKENIANDILTVLQYDEVKRVAKRQVLNSFFQDLILDDTDLDALIESKRGFYKSQVCAK